METDKTQFIFSRPREERLFVNYGDKIGILGMSAIAAVQIFFYPGASIPPIRWLYVLLFMFALSALMSITFRRFAHRITIDTVEGVIVFDMLRGVTAVKAEIDKLEAIHLGFHVSFLISGKRLFYNGVTNKKLVEVLEMLRPIEWRHRGRWIYKHW